MGPSLPTRLEVGDNSRRGATVLPAASPPGRLPAVSAGLVHRSWALPSVPRVDNQTIKASGLGQVNVHITIMVRVMPPGYPLSPAINPSSWRDLRELVLKPQPPAGRSSAV